MSIFQTKKEMEDFFKKPPPKRLKIHATISLIIYKLVMSNFKQGLILILLIVLAINQKTPENSVSEFFSDYRQGVAYKKGLTFQATVWPI